MMRGRRWLLQFNPTGSGHPVEPGLRFQLTSYDAADLELALRLQLPIVTRASKLARSFAAEGVGHLPKSRAP